MVSSEQKPSKVYTVETLLRLGKERDKMDFAKPKKKKD